MADTNYFYGNNGKLSSIRTTIGCGKSRMSITSYPSTGKGGITFKNGSITTRINNRNGAISTGLKCGRNTTYFSGGKVIKNIPEF